MASVRKRFKGRLIDALNEYGRDRANEISRKVDLLGDSGSNEKFREFFELFTNRNAAGEISPRDLDVLLAREVYNKQGLIDKGFIPDDSPMPDNIVTVVPYDVVIVDTAIATWTHIDENNANEVRKALQPFDRWVDRNNTTFIYIHHEGKDESKGGRGSSDWTAFAANIISVRNKEGQYTLQFTKGRDLYDDRINMPWETFQVAKNGGWRQEYREVNDAMKESQYEMEKHSILLAHGGPWKNKTAVAETMGGKKKFDLVDKFVQDGRLVVDGKQHSLKEV